MLAIKKRLSQLPVLAWLTLLGLGLGGCKPPGVQTLVEGEELIRQGKYAEATQVLQKAVQLLPTNAQAFNHLGLAYHGSGQLDQAGRAYRQALALDHQLAAARYNLGCLQLELGNPAAAVDELTSYTMLQPKSIPGWLKLGSAQLHIRRFDAAEAAYKAVLQLQPNHPDALNGLGVLNVQRKRPFDALSFFNQALAHNTNYAPALLNLAVLAQRQLYNPQLALEKYRAYLALEPRPANWEEVAAVADRLRMEVAKAQEQNPSTAGPPPNNQTPQVANPVVPNEAAGTQTPPPKPAPTRPTPPPASPSQQGQRQLPAEPGRAAPRSGAETAASPPAAAVSNAPAPARPQPAASSPSAQVPSPSATAAGANRYRYLSPPRPARGDRREADKQLQLGLRAHRAGQAGQALAHYDSAVRADPGWFEARFNQGLAAQQAGKIRDALQAYEYGLALRPDSIDARFNFALALKQAGYPRDAAVELEKVVQARPKDVLAQLSLANVYAQQLNQPSQARSHYLKVLELAPKHPEAPRIRSWLGRNP